MLLAGTIRVHHHDGTSLLVGTEVVRDSVLVGLGELVIRATDEALRGIDGVVDVSHALAESGLADDALAALPCDDGRGGTVAVRVGDYGRLVAFHDCHARICGTKVDADALAHIAVTLLLDRGSR